MDLTAEELWAFLPLGYLLTIAIEIPILLFSLSPSHPPGRRLLAGCWLTACTYPVVILVLPLTVAAWWGNVAYLAVRDLRTSRRMPAVSCSILNPDLPRPCISGHGGDRGSKRRLVRVWTLDLCLIPVRGTRGYR